LGPRLLWPNGCMDQDATWYEGRPRPTRHCYMKTQPPAFPIGAQPPIFVQCPLWPNGGTNEDTIWYGSRPRPRSHCIRRGPSSPRKGHSSPSALSGPCLFWPLSPISAAAELLIAFFLPPAAKPPLRTLAQTTQTNGFRTRMCLFGVATFAEPKFNI